MHVPPSFYFSIKKYKVNPCVFTRISKSVVVVLYWVNLALSWSYISQNFNAVWLLVKGHKRNLHKISKMKLKQVQHLEVGAEPQVLLQVAPVVPGVLIHRATVRPAAPPAGCPLVSPSPGPTAYCSCIVKALASFSSLPGTEVGGGERQMQVPVYLGRF